MNFSLYFLFAVIFSNILDNDYDIFIFIKPKHHLRPNSNP